MDSKKLNEIGRRIGIGGRKLDLFVQFMAKRFPNERDTGYCSEWAQRFQKGTEWAHSDKQSRAVLTSLDETEYQEVEVSQDG